MQALEKTADAPGSGQKWRRKKVCKSCYWLRQIDCASDGWDGKCCAYTYITDRFREIPRRMIAAHIISKRKERECNERESYLNARRCA